MCEDAPCCGCCSPAEIWNPHPADYDAWEEWMNGLQHFGPDQVETETEQS
jgi:hypothetical protein